MMTALLTILGWLVAHTPERLLGLVAVLLGEAILWLAPRRRRLILANLHHAFPTRPPAWYRAMARTGTRRLVETGLLSLATPFLSERRIRSMARLAPSLESWIRLKYGPGARAPGAGADRPVVLNTFHTALWESQTWFKAICPVAVPEFGIIFRPLKHAALDAYVKRTRERHGLRLLSRKDGFAEALAILRRGGVVGVLFDQNAGRQGALTTFFGRICSTTELPGVLATKFDAEVRTFYPQRIGFWRVEFRSDPIAHDGSVAGITVALNRWLESALTEEDACASWLWAHDRWRHQDIPAQRLRLESRRNLLADDLRLRGLPALPRRTRVWLRLPNWLGDTVIALPLIRALRRSRPDAEIHLLAPAGQVPLLLATGVADAVHPLPPRGAAYFSSFLRLRQAYPDLWILFTNSVRGDIEAWLSGSPQRFGIVRPGRPRPLLTHGYRVPADYDESRHHQLELWQDFLRHFGLETPPDLTPLSWARSSPDAIAPADRPIGLIPGSENNPAKRWPVAHWRRLISADPERSFVLFGTARDLPIAAAVAEGFPAERVRNLAGRTDLLTYAGELRQCRLVVANDTGGMHLANALGVPLIALFGPTNPIRTKPVFAAPCTILQPPGCPPTGGASLAELAPDQVIFCLRNLGLSGSPLSPTS